MKHHLATDPLTHEFRLLRNRIEAEIHAPGVLLVTSATDNDGANLTAYGLAESLSKTHQRTALLTTSTTAATTPESSLPATQTPRRRASDRLDGGNIAGAGGFSIVSVSHERLATISRSSMAGLVQGLRAEHDYVVIDAGGLPDNSFGLLLLTSADAVLIAFRAGRQQLAADRTMLDTLEKSEAKLLGVVMNDQGAIGHFEETATKREPGMTRESVTGETNGVPVLSPFLRRFDGTLQRIGKSI
jgi:Mrp family chromosome partitioning ATPase